MLDKARWWLIIITAVLLISFVVLMGVLRLALPYFTSYKDEIESKLQQTLNHPVTISRIDAGWHWFSPELRVIDVNVYKPDGKANLIHFDNVLLRYNVIENLIKFAFEPTEIILDTAYIDIKRSKAGEIFVQGIELKKNNASGSGIVIPKELLSPFAGKEFRLINSTIQWRDKYLEAESKKFKDFNLAVQIFDDEYRFEVKSKSPPEFAQDIHVVAVTKATDKDWVSSVYVKARSLSISALSRYFESQRFRVSAFVTGEVWLDFKNTKIESISTDFSANEITIESIGKKIKKSWLSKKMSTALKLTRFDDTWEVVVDKMNVQLDKTKWEDVYFSVNYKESDNSLKARFDYLNLSDVSELVASLPVDNKWIKQLNEVSPQGELRKTDVQIDDWRKPNNWLVQTQFNKLGLTVPQENIKIANVSGGLKLEADSGRITLDSQNAVVVSKYFNNPLKLDALQADIDIDKFDNNYEFFSESVYSKVDGVNIHARVNYNLSDTDFLDLQVRFDGADAKWLNKHRTDEFFGKDAAQWLSESVIEGEFGSAGLMFHGVPGAYPFKNNDGVFQSVVTVSNGVLKYQPDWPSISDIKARFVLDNEMITIDRSTARLGESIISNTTTAIDFSVPIHVVINGDVDTNSRDVERFFKSTPLKQDYNDLTAYTSVDGKFKTNLMIDIPLETDEDVNVSGDVLLDNNTLRVKDFGYVINRVNGIVEFNNANIHSKKLTGEFSGSSVLARLKTVKSEVGLKTLLQARFNADVISVVPSGIDTDTLFTGKTKWDLLLDVEHDDVASGQLMSLSIESDLSGVKFNLPEPLAKLSNTSADIDLVFKVFNTSSLLKMTYDKKLDLGMRWDEGFKNIKSDIRLMNGSVKKLKNGINLSVNATELDAQKWKAIVLPFILDDESVNAEDLAVNINVHSGRVGYADLDLHQVSLSASYDNNWKVSLESDEVSGDITVPANFDNNDVVKMDFTKLDLSSMTSDENASVNNQQAEEENKWDVSAKAIPALKINAKNFVYKNYKFDTLSMVTSRTSYGMTVHALDVTGKELDVKLKGNWFSKVTGPDTSNFRIEIESNDVGKMLSSYGFTESIEGGKGRAVVDWQWNASPFNFDWRLVAGRMQTEVTEGSFVDVEPGAGRLLGMFSLRALPKRFFLDFSDTFTEGFEFIKFRSQANFSNGHLYTNNTKIMGDSADVFFRGRVGLADRDYDQIMSVIPRISSGVSGWIAVAQGAAIGLTAYIGQKLLGIDEAAKNQYHISGSWSEPVIKKLGDTIEENNDTEGADEE